MSTRVLAWAGALAGVPATAVGGLLFLCLAIVLLCARVRSDRRHLAEQRERTRAALEEILRIGSLASEFSAATTAAEVAEVAFRACRSLGATHASIGWVIGEGEVETVNAFGHDALRSRWARYRIETPGPNADALRAAAPIVLETPAAIDAAYPGFARLRRQAGVAAWISWPLVVRRTPQGVLGIGFSASRTLARAERTILGAIAEHAAQAFERARLLAQIEDSERRFRLLAENAPDVVYRYRLEPLTCEYMSPAVTRVLGCTPEEHYRDPDILFQLVLPEDRAALDASLRAPDDAPHVLRWRRPDGTVIWAEHRNVLIRDEQDAPLAIEGIARDVTERVELEAERERLVCEREDLLRAVSHDVRTPLQAVLLRAEALARDPGNAAKATRTAQAIAASARRMSAALQDVVHLVRLSPGGIRPSPQQIALAPFVDDLCQRLFPEHAVARLTIALEPDAAVRADPDHLERILTNLVDNALKYSAAPAPVRIASEAVGAERVVTVSDVGQGIPPEDVPRLFERYFRGTRPPGQPGTGLGLYVTRLLVEAQGGTVSVESAPGRGSVFRVRLPAA